MAKRKRVLPPGWYPNSREKIIDTFKQWEGVGQSSLQNGISGVVPHAGWMFSGELAYKVFRRLSPEVDTVIIIGGHLPPNSGCFAAKEDMYETPLGDLITDKEFLSLLEEKISVKTDTFSDNTVEVQLPFVKYFYPKAQAVGLRVEPSEKAVDLGDMIADITARLKKKIAVIGSTDLTHYGLSYGYAPRGTGEDAFRWVTEVNDKDIIEALLEFDFTEALRKGNEDKAACSIGAAVAAGAYAAQRKDEDASSLLVDYYTSRKVHKADSFVGYAGILYS